MTDSNVLKTLTDVFDGNVPEVYRECIRNGKRERGGVENTIPETRGNERIERRVSGEREGLQNSHNPTNNTNNQPNRSNVDNDRNFTRRLFRSLFNPPTTTTETDTNRRRRVNPMNNTGSPSQASFTPTMIGIDPRDPRTMMTRQTNSSTNFSQPGTARSTLPPPTTMNRKRGNERRNYFKVQREVIKDGQRVRDDYITHVNSKHPNNRSNVDNDRNFTRRLFQSLLNPPTTTTETNTNRRRVNSMNNAGSPSQLTMIGKGTRNMTMTRRRSNSSQNFSRPGRTLPPPPNINQRRRINHMNNAGSTNQLTTIGTDPRMMMMTRRRSNSCLNFFPRTIGVVDPRTSSQNFSPSPFQPPSQSSFSPTMIRNDPRTMTMKRLSIPNQNFPLPPPPPPPPPHQKQTKCCVLDCDDDVTSKRNFSSLRDGSVGRKPLYDDWKWIKICYKCYFKYRYHRKKKARSGKSQAKISPKTIGKGPRTRTRTRTRTSIRTRTMTRPPNPHLPPLIPPPHPQIICCVLGCKGVLSGVLCKFLRDENLETKPLYIRWNWTKMCDACHFHYHNRRKKKK